MDIRRTPTVRMKANPFLNIVLEETYEDGEIIFKEGNSGDWVYVVLSGAVEVSKATDGTRYVLSTLKPGDVFGELALIGAVRRTATTRAIGRTVVGIIDRAFLDREFNKLSTDFRTVLVAMVERFIKTMDRAREFTAL
jgi:CRP-like cAMP-binding protein